MGSIPAFGSRANIYVMYIGFTKMHGSGNDFIVIDNLSGRISLSIRQISDLCDRRKGIGADGIILVESKEGTDCFMRYYNSDGSPAKMCGNGIRCTALFLKRDYLKEKEFFKIDTLDGIKEISWKGDNYFSVNMGKATFKGEEFGGKERRLEGVDLKFSYVGNPFAIGLVQDLGEYDISVLGPLIENHKSFPNKMNFEMVQKKSDTHFKVLVWERGCGKVLACGTGACAAFALMRREKEASEKAVIELPGGNLQISENKKGEIVMEGPAEVSFSGMVELQDE